VGNIPGSFLGAAVGRGVEPGVEDGGRMVAREEDWTERRVRVMSRGYVITTDVIPAIAPAVNRNGVVNSVCPGGIKNYSSVQSMYTGSPGSELKVRDVTRLYVV
jgi:hypothetical protein